jgi:uroporphyrinogen decarboxylase
MISSISRRGFLNSVIAASAASIRRNDMPQDRDKRDTMLNLLEKDSSHEYVPAAFFLHFDKSCHFGQAGVEKHLEYFRYTNMDFVKIQYERTFPQLSEIRKSDDWKKMPLYKLDFYEPELQVVRGLVKAAKKDALILVTLYSPFMCAGHSTSQSLLSAHLSENPDHVKKGLDIITESLMLFVKECVRLGVDGFYTSTQGGEAGRFKDPKIFTTYIKPQDLVLMKEINQLCIFNILHVCDYNAPYDDLTPFLDYPGHVVNCNPQLTTGALTWNRVAELFKRPCMGGLDRHGTIVGGTKREIAGAVEKALSAAPPPFILGADCTLPNDINWENISAAIDAAHAFKNS